MNTFKSYRELVKFLRQSQPSLLNIRFYQIEARVRKKPLRRPTDTGQWLVVVPIACFGLGTWQVKRLFWKKEIMSKMDEKLKYTPAIPIPKELVDSDAVPELEYTRYAIEGEFIHSHEVLITPRKNSGSDNSSHGGLISVGSGSTGAHVITPFKLADRDAYILVNRGFVPKEKMYQSERLIGQVQGKVKLTGVLRQSEKAFFFMPKDSLQSNGTYLYRKISEIAKNLGTLPLLLEADENSTVPGGPIGGQTRVFIQNDHFSYLVTWYTLAIILGYAWYRTFRNPKKLPLEVAKAYKKSW